MRWQIWWNLTEADWDEAFNAHPRIGDVNALKQVNAACLPVHCRARALTVRTCMCIYVLCSEIRIEPQGVGRRRAKGGEQRD